MQGYIQFFRNTPPLVQLYFFYFALGSYLRMTSAAGLEVPLVTNFTWAAICLSLYAGAFNVEIFRAGIEAVPKETVEAAESARLQPARAYLHVILPLAFRISLPALNNNLVNLVKTTTIAYAIAVPGDALRRQPDLVGRVERDRDDERAAAHLRGAGRRAWSTSWDAGSGRCAFPATCHDRTRRTHTDLAVLKPFRRRSSADVSRLAVHGAARLRR